MKNQLTLALRKSLIECSGQDLYYFQKEEKKIPYEMLKSVSPRKNPKLLPNVSKERTKSHENRKNKAVVALPINYLKKRIEVVTTGRSTPTSIQGTLNKAINNTTSTKTKKNFFNESRRHSRPMSIERKSDNSNSIMSKSPKNSSQELGCSDYLHKEKKIDLERHKRQEKTAATMIQA